MSKEKKDKKGLNIQLDPETAEGIYSNLAFIAHSEAEFIVDFINKMPGTNAGKVKSRIILTPQHAKRLMLALQDNIKKFEQQNGEIQVKGKSTPLPMNFNGITGEA